MSTAPVIALSESVPEAGAVVYWSLAGSPPLAAVLDVMETAGITPEEGPTQPSPAVALHQAACEVFKGCLVRPLPQGGLAVVEEKATEDGSLEHRVLWHAVLDQGTAFLNAQANQPWQEGAPAGDRLQAAWHQALATCPAAHLGDWLIRRVRLWGGVGLRDRGSVYFLPPAAMPAFRALRDALAAVPGTDYRFSVIPALRGDEAVEAVLNAVLAEAEKEAASMEADLAKDLGKRAMENRIGRCEAVESKVAQYERLLDKSMGGMRERLDALRVQLTVAMLKPTAEEEKTG